MMKLEDKPDMFISKFCQRFPRKAIHPLPLQGYTS